MDNVQVQLHDATTQGGACHIPVPVCCLGLAYHTQYWYQCIAMIVYNVITTVVSRSKSIAKNSDMTLTKSS